MREASVSANDDDDNEALAAEDDDDTIRLRSVREPLEIQNNESWEDAITQQTVHHQPLHGSLQQRQRQPLPQWWVVLRFGLLSVIALVATFCCPGDTILWRIKDTTTSSTSVSNHSTPQPHLQTDVVLRIFVTSMTTFLAFFVLHGSNPGYLTAEIMEQLDLAENEDNDDDDEVVAFLKNVGTNDDDNDDNTNNVDQVPQQPLNLEQQPIQLNISNGSSSSPGRGGGGGVTRRLAASSASRDPLEAPANSPERDDPSNPTGTTASANDHYHHSSRSYYRSTRRARCEICQFAPPLRAHHCKTCQKCVATFDHHCDFVGTCIGERNHCRFWAFLVAQTAAFWTFGQVVGSSRLGLFTLVTARHRPPTVWHSLGVVLAKLYLYPLTACSIILLLLHTVCCLTNSTTFECAKGHRLEYLKGAHENLMDLPFSRSSAWQNVHLFCCQRDDAAGVFQRGILLLRQVLESCGGTLNNNNNNNDSRSKQGAPLSSPRTLLWSPMVWRPPGKIIRDSEDWWEHPLQNKYWSCC